MSVSSDKNAVKGVTEITGADLKFLFYQKF